MTLRSIDGFSTFVEFNVSAVLVVGVSFTIGLGDLSALLFGESVFTVDLNDSSTSFFEEISFIIGVHKFSVSFFKETIDCGFETSVVFLSVSFFADSADDTSVVVYNLEPDVFVPPFFDFVKISFDGESVSFMVSFFDGGTYSFSWSYLTFKGGSLLPSTIDGIAHLSFSLLLVLFLISICGVASGSFSSASFEDWGLRFFSSSKRVVVFALTDIFWGFVFSFSSVPVRLVERGVAFFLTSLCTST
mmetsp:Transcript_9463/g.14550  ORF Transcript_9463/g.14550 Transcript_9463/m.14550 type:complete len:246 (-) Transcript_9463:81-818(-)